MQQLIQCMRTSKMKYLNIIKSIIFLSILFILFILLSDLFVPKNNYKKLGMNNIEANGILGEKDNSIDVLFLGDSEAYTSMSPLIMYNKYGFTSYVCATPGQRIYDTLKYFNKALEKQKPKVIVIETNAIYRKYNFFENMVANWKNYFPLFEYHNRWKELNKNDFIGKVEYTYMHPNKGFKIKRKIVPAKLKDYMKETDKRKYVPSNNASYIQKMIKVCKENNIKLVLISSPSIKNWNYSKHLGIASFASKNNLNYYDLNVGNAADIDWLNDTVDKGDHLNINGAKKSSLKIGEYLVNNYDLIDHRGEEEYSSWDIRSQEFMEEIEK